MLALVAAAAAGWVVSATNAEGPSHIPMVHDWSHRHVMFSQPSTLAQTWKLQIDPARYWMQVIRRNAARSSTAEMKIYWKN